jgi:hypothetical protein
MKQHRVVLQVRLNPENSRTVTGLAALYEWSETRTANHLITEALSLIGGTRSPSQAKAYLDTLTALVVQRRKSADAEKRWRRTLAQLRPAPKA